MLPNFLVIGSPRCGTTWVHDNLVRHPEVFLPREKELHFFDRHYHRGIDYYASAFRNSEGAHAVGESTPDYLSGVFSKNRNIPETIHRHLPSAKLIAVLRNPVERAYSHYCYNMAKDARNIGLTFEQKLEQRPQIIEEGRYADHISRYLSLFDRQQLLILLYDDLKRDPSTFLRQIYSFLGVDSTFQSGLESLTRNTAQGRGNLARSRFVWHIGRALGRAGFLRLSERIREANTAKGLAPMRADTRRKLTELYRPGNARLSELLGRDLSAWNSEFHEDQG